MKRATVACLTLLVAASAGCLSPDQASELATLPAGIAVARIPMGAALNDEGKNFQLVQNPPGATTLRWINDDVVTHTVMAMAEGQVATGPMQNSGDGHEGHDHAAVTSDPASGMMFQFGLPPGESVDVPLGAQGVVRIHCVDHTWMDVQWSNGPAGLVAERQFAVNIRELVDGGNATGDTAVGEQAELAWEITQPNLDRIEIILAWNDSADDVGPAGAANGEDTLRVQLVDPSGAVVAEGEATSRNGVLLVVHKLEAESWPRTIAAHSEAAAKTQLDQQRPTSHAGTGTWTTLVTTVSAPGVAPASDLDALGLPDTDGHQAWRLDFRAIHHEASFGAPGAASHTNGHEHGHADHGGHGN